MKGESENYLDSFADILEGPSHQQLLSISQALRYEISMFKLDEGHQNRLLMSSEIRSQILTSNIL